MDSSLKFRGKYVRSSMIVYEVEKNNQIYILKGAKLSDDFNYNNLNIEIDLLKQAKEKQVEGISNIIKDYEVVENYKFMLKEFFEGTDAYVLKFDFRTAANSNKLYTKLQNTINGLHSCDIAGLDIIRNNFILSPNLNDVCFIDPFGSISFAFKKDLNFKDFELLKEHDGERLYNLFYHDKKEIPKLE